MEKKFSLSPFYLWLKIIDTKADILLFLTNVSHTSLCSFIAKFYPVAKLFSSIVVLEAIWNFLHYIAAKYVGMCALRFLVLVQLREAFIQLFMKCFVHVKEVL